MLARLWLSSLGAALFVAEAGFAQSGQCPSQGDVDRAVRVLLTRGNAAAAEFEPKFAVEDAGNRYTVTVKGRSRVFADPARDCQKRADVAAVFVALTLAPPDIPEAEREPRAAPPAAVTEDARAASGGDAPARTDTEASKPTSVVAKADAARASAGEGQRDTGADATRSASSARELAFMVELGGRAALTPRSGGAAAGLLGDVGIGVLRDNWGLVLGAGLSTPASYTLEGVSVRERRLPLALSARREWPRGTVRAAVDAGLVADVVRVEREAEPQAPTTTVVQWGGRARASVGFEATISPYALIFTEFFPGGRELALEPRGTIGRVSWLWFGVGVGVSGRWP